MGIAPRPEGVKEPILAGTRPEQRYAAASWHVIRPSRPDGPVDGRAWAGDAGTDSRKG